PRARERVPRPRDGSLRRSDSARQAKAQSARHVLRAHTGRRRPPGAAQKKSGARTLFMSSRSASDRIVSGPLALSVARFGAPLALGMALQTTFNLVDAYLISRLEPEIA